MAGAARESPVVSYATCAVGLASSFEERPQAFQHVVFAADFAEDEFGAAVVGFAGGEGFVEHTVEAT